MQTSVDWNVVVNIFLGLAALGMSGVALYYKRLEHRKSAEEIIDGNSKIALFISRQSMLKHLLDMYKRASSPDEIWGQSVSGRDYSKNVRDTLLDAASRGVSFRIIVSGEKSTSEGLVGLFKPLKSAQLALGGDNNLRIQGLSEKECVIALPNANVYVAVLFRDEVVVKIFKSWFDERFNKLISPEHQ